MRNFTQKPKSTQQASSARPRMVRRSRFGQNREQDSILQLKPNIGNQARVRMLERDEPAPQPQLLDVPATGFRRDFRRISGNAKDALFTSKLKPTHSNGTDKTEEIVTEGIRGPGRRMPHFEHIQRSFAHYDLLNVQAHTGEMARRACDAIGALAFTKGNHIAFRQAPDIATVAHEVTHVVQQSQGGRSAGGIGPAGVSRSRITDPSEAAEIEAETVARAVARGERVSVAPRAEMHGAIARIPLQQLRDEWSPDVHAKILAARQFLIDEGRVEDAEALLETAEPAARRFRGDPNFPQAARHAASRVLQAISLILAGIRVETTGGLSGAFMASLLDEILTLASAENIFRDGDMSPDDLSLRRHVWTSAVYNPIRSMIEIHLRDRFRRGYTVSLDADAYEPLSTLPAYAQAVRESAAAPQAVRARIHHLARRLAQLRALVEQARRPVHGPEAHRMAQLFTIALSYSTAVIERLDEALSNRPSG